MDLNQQTGLVGDLNAVTEPTTKLHPNQVVEDAAYTSLKGGRPDFPLKAQAVRSELDMNGESQEVAEVKTNASLEQDARLKQALYAVVEDPNSTPHEIAQAIQEYEELRTQFTDLGVDGAYDFLRTETNNEIAEMKAKFVPEMLWEQRQDARLESWELFSQKEIESPLGWAIDVAEALIPGAEQLTTVGLAKELGIPTDASDYILFGSLKKEIATKFATASPDRVMEMAYRTKKWLDENAGFFGTNDYLAYTYADQFIANPNLDTASEFIDNFIGALDVVALGATVKSGLKLFNRTPKALVDVPKGSPLQNIQMMTPAQGEDLIVRGITTEGEQALSALGATRQQAKGTMLPKPSISLDSAKFVDSVPAKVGEKVNNVQQKMRVLAREAHVPNRMLINETEVKAAAETTFARIQKEIGLLLPYDNPLMTISNVPTSPITYTDKGYSIRALLQPETGKGWTSYNAMVNDLSTKLKGGDLKGVEVWTKPAGSNKWEVVTGKLPKKKDQQEAEWAYSIDVEYADDPTWKMALGSDDVNASYGEFQKYLAGPQGSFSKWLRDGATVARDRAAGFENRLHKLAEQIVKDIPSKKEFDDIIEALQDGDVHERIWSPQDLQSRYGIPVDSPAMDAYYQFRAFQDEMWAMANADTRRLMVREGYNSLYDASGKLTGQIVKPYTVNEAKGIISQGQVVVYNLTKQSFETVHKNNIDKLYQRGHTIVKLNEAMRNGNDVFEYAVLTASKDLRLGRLTSTPLPYRHGHVSRYYTHDEYLIKVKNPKATRNGRADTDYEETVGIAASLKDAERFAKERAGDFDENAEFVITPTRDIKKGVSAEEIDYQSISGGYMRMQKRRGDRLVDYTGAEAAIENPLQSMGRSVSALSHRATVKEWYDTQITAWHKTYADKLDFKDVPATLADLKGHVSKVTARKSGLEKIAKEAQMHYQYINMVRGSPSILTQKWKAWWMNAAGKIDNDVLRKGAEYVSNKKPLVGTKQLAFTTMLAWNPIKHLLLQPSQLIQMSFLEPVYMSTKFVKEFSETVASLSLNRGTKLGDELANEFNKTGLMDSVKKHVYLNPGSEANMSPIAPQFADPGMRTARTIKKAGVDFPQKGFEWGEDANVIGHWLVARKRWIDRNPSKNWKSDMARAEIQADMRDISLNFSPAGKMGYQDWGTAVGGGTSMLLQFFSHSHKMMMSILPEVAGGSKAFTKAEKVKLATGNVLLFGTATIPFLNSYMDEVITAVDPDMDPVTAQAIKTGAADVLISKAISIAAGEDVDLRPSAAFNPMGNIEATLETFYDVVSMSPEHRPFVSAPIAALSNVLTTANLVSNIWAMDDEVFASEDKYLRTLLTMAEIAPQVSNITKATMAYKTGKLTSKYGNEVGEVNTIEALSKIAGLAPGVEVDYYEAMNGYFGLKRSGRDAEIQKEVEEYFKQFNQTMKTAPYNNAEKVAMFEASLLLQYDHPKEKRIVMRTLNKMRKKMQTSGIENIFTRIQKDSVMSSDIDAYRKFTQLRFAPSSLKTTIDSMGITEE